MNKLFIKITGIVIGGLALIMILVNVVTSKPSQDEASLASTQDVLAPTHDNVVGAWVGKEAYIREDGTPLYEGFELYADGTAKSINTATLVVEEWTLSTDRLTLVEKSIGNGQTFVEETSYMIEFLDSTGNEMMLVFPEGYRSYGSSSGTVYIREPESLRAENPRY